MNIIKTPGRLALLCLLISAPLMSSAAESAAPAPAASQFEALAMRCAPQVDHDLLGRVASVESSGNPFAIGVVHGHLARQPGNLPEAMATVKALDAGGWNYSLGVVQVNVHNLARFGQTVDSIFDPCTNLKTGAAILKECYERARAQAMADAVRGALSCYYSGDLARGAAYAMKVAAAAPVSAVSDAPPIDVVPDIAKGASGAQAPRGPAKAPRPGKGDDQDDWFMTYGDDDDAPAPQVNSSANGKGGGNDQ